MEKEETLKPAQRTFKDYYEKYMFVVGILGQSLFFAQALKIYQTKSAADVSLTGFCFGLISVSSWFLYGILIKNRVLIAANLIAMVGAFLVVLGTLIY